MIRMPFAFCPACAAEYDDPGSRRFHAQSIAYPQCGPTAWFVDFGGSATRPPQAAGSRTGRSLGFATGSGGPASRWP